MSETRPNENGDLAVGRCTTCGNYEVLSHVWLQIAGQVLKHCGECPSCGEEDMSYDVLKFKEIL